MAWERWQSLSPEEKERYKKQARGFAERGKKTLDDSGATPLAVEPWVRPCPRCGAQIAVARRCRHCEYEIE